jgi:hypothetical protein
LGDSPNLENVAFCSLSWPGFVPAIREKLEAEDMTWMPGISPGMTKKNRPCF